MPSLCYWHCGKESPGWGLCFRVRFRCNSRVVSVYLLQLVLIFFRCLFIEVWTNLPNFPQSHTRKYCVRFQFLLEMSPTAANGQSSLGYRHCYFFSLLKWKLLNWLFQSSCSKSHTIYGDVWVLLARSKEPEVIHRRVKYSFSISVDNNKLSIAFPEGLFYRISL